MYNLYNKGWIEVICGGMFAGKSEELIRRINTLTRGNQHVVIFKPTIDNRYSEDEVVSHNGTKVKCHSISSSKEIYNYVDNSVDAVAIDEVQFFDNDIVNVANELADKGIRVIVAGLDMDYLGSPFGPMPSLLAIAEFVTKLTAVCNKCGAPATRTQKLNLKTNYVVEIGEKNKYSASCRHCHKVAE